MRLFIIVLMTVLLLGCTDNKNATFFKKHPERVLSNAIECTKLPEKEVLNNKTCLGIADFEKPDCDQELKVKGMIFLPGGGLADCNDKLYLIARPILEAKMQAYLQGQPDPVAEYLKKHPK